MGPRVSRAAAGERPNSSRESTGAGPVTGPGRLAFGHVAELYDRMRPPLPVRAIDHVLAAGRLGPGALVVEIGAGTGKATVELARRDLRVLALEPDAEMARVLEANCAPWPGVRVARVEFECWEADEPARAIVSANAWHWLDPRDRWARAHRSLAAGGLLAAIWTLPEWSRCPLRSKLGRVYRQLAPDLAPDFPMHPDSNPMRLAGDWSTEVDECRLFTSPGQRELRWSARFDATDYPTLLRTHQDHILVEPEVRERLLMQVSATVAAHGVLVLPLVTRICTALRP